MISNSDNEYMYNIVRNSNMRQLSRQYRACKSKCSLPSRCVFSINPVFYSIVGNYTKSNNSEYNTILTFVEDATIVSYIPLKTKVSIALASDPNTIVFTNEFTQPPGIYSAPAGSEGFIITSSFNVPSC